MVPDDLVAAIRKRPGMYIGDLDPHPMLWEVVSNCVDLELAGRALQVEVEIHADNSVSIRDDGPGIGLSLEQLFVHGHVTPTADGHAPHVHLTRRGIGLIVVSALSERVEVRTRRGDAMVRQSFARGVATSELEREAGPPSFGTRIQFWPDPDVFGRFRWDFGAIDRRLQELVALRSRLACNLVVAPRSLPAGPGLMTLLPDKRAPLHAEPIEIALTRDCATARVALRWSARRALSRLELRSFCNMIETSGGKHLLGFERGVGRAIAEAAPSRFWNAWRKAYEHVSPCLSAVVAVEIVDPTWRSPVKDHPQNPELAEVTEAAILAELPGWFAQHPEVLAALLEPGDYQPG